MSAAAPYQRLTAKAPHPPSSSPLVLQQFHGCQGHAIPDADPITASSVAELSLTMMATLEHQHRCWKLYKLAYADDDPRRPPVDPATFKARLCLEAIFGCMDLVEQPLLGKNVMDLQRLFATQPSQEHYAAFRVVEQIAHDPLAHSSTQGPILPSLPAPDAARHPNTQLVRQDQAIIDRQRVQAFRQFGPECPNVFKRIEIQHTAPWSPNLDHLLVNRAESHKDLDFSLSMTVTIQGSSVMQGLKALTERGMVNGVLPDFLTQLPSKGTNHTVVERGL
ncbi:hypothetical protein H4R35_003001 [Dimargaris xerosporica]|nr:hypothetical protein H4R35_003001 [Dimargaris xerosporica]